MPRFTAVAVLAAVAALAPVAPAGAIVNGVVDNGAHPNVGTVIRRDVDGVLYRSCSGTLISPTVFLTAAHCVAPFPGLEGDEIIGVSFEDVTPAVPSYLPGTAYPNPLFHWSRGVGPGLCCGSGAFDNGVVVLDQPVSSPTPAALPTLGLLDQLNKKNGLHATKFVVVGYGATGGEQPGYAHCCIGAGTRRYGVETFRSLDKTMLHQSMNAAGGDSGTCYGDSGGPHFLGTTNVVVAITSTGDSACVSSDMSYRIDTVAAREFLGRFVALP
jgi:hypothetical protein